MNNFITAGELASLASTTKRTIHFYDEKEILKPSKINSAGYRFYLEKQILDYQMILLLSTLKVPLSEMKQYIKRKGDLVSLFNEKKLLIQEEIKQLQFNLNNLNKYLQNIKKNGTMVNPVIKIVPQFSIFYIEKKCAYAKIGHYCSELINMLNVKKNAPTTLAIFEDTEYLPKKSRIKIGVLANNNILVKKEFINIVKKITINPGKVITYTHNGSGRLLSLFWKELEKYCSLNKIKVRKKFPDFEIYRKVNSDVTKQFFEIYLPIY